MCFKKQNSVLPELDLTVVLQSFISVPSNFSLVVAGYENGGANRLVDSFRHHVHNVPFHALFIKPGYDVSCLQCCVDRFNTRVVAMVVLIFLPIVR